MAISFTIQSISILNTAPWRDSSILLSSGDLGFLSTVSDKFTIPVNHILLFQFSDFNDLSATAYVSLLIIILFLFIIYRNHKKSASRIEELKIELHNTNEKYDDIIQNLAEGFALHEVIRDEKGKIIDYRFLLLNSAFEKITGLRKDFTVGKRVLELLPNTEQYWIDIFGKVVTTGEPVKYEKFAQEFDKYFEVVAYRSSMNRFVTIFNDISDRKKVLDELKLKELAISSSVNAIVIANLDGIISYTNSAFLKLWRISDSSLVTGRNCFDFWADMNEAHSMLKELNSQGSFIGEITAYRPEGTTFDVLVAATLVLDEERKPKNIIISFIDISEKKAAEDAIALAEKRFRALIENAPDGIVLSGEDGKIKYASPAAIRLIGQVNYEKTNALDLVDVVYEEDREQVVALQKKVILNTDELVSTQYRINQPDGTYRWIESIFSNKFEVPGIEAIVVNFRDIHKQKTAEEKLRESEEKYRLLAENAGDVIWIMDLNGKMIYVSPSVYKLRGISPEENMQESMQDNLTPDSYKLASEQLELAKSQISAGNKPEPKRLILEQYKKDKSTIWTEIILSAVYDENDNFKYILGVTRDFDERKKIEDKLIARDSLLTTIIEHAPFEVWIRDKNDVGILENRLTKEHFGSIIGKTTDEITISEDYRQKWISNNLRVRNGEIIEEEVSYKTVNGEKFYQNILAPIYVNGEYEGIAGFNIDISERKFAENIKRVQYEIAKAMIHSRDLHELFSAMQKALSAVIDSTNMFIGMYDKKNDEIFTEYFGDEYDTIDRWKAAGSLSGMVLNKKKTLLLKDNDFERMVNEGQIQIIGKACKSWLGAPLFIGNETVGVFVVQSYDDPYAYNEQSVEIMEIAANQLSGYLEKKIAQEQLVNSANQLEFLVNNLPLVLFALDNDGKFTLSTGKALADIGFKPGEVVGKSALELYKDYPELVNDLKNSLAGEYINRIHFIQGVWFELWYMPVYNHENIREGIIGVGVNISQRKLAEEQIHASHETYKGIFDSINDMIFVQDETGKFIDVNDVACKVLGYNKEQLIGNNPECISAEGYNDMKHLWSMFAETIKGKSSKFDFWALKSEGTIIPIEVVISPGEYFGSKVVIALGRNIAEQKEYEQELRSAKDKAEESDKLKSAFLANMSHEIRTPMNAILGFSHLLEANDLEPEQKKEYISFIHKRGKDLLAIINDILDISKIEAGQLKLFLVECDINLLVKNVYQTFAINERFRSDSNDLELRIGRIKEDLPIILTDEQRLGQILNNLLSNAIKFTESGFIELGYDIVGENIRFYVKDTGIGIPKSKQKLIFERFRQSEDNHLIREFDGAGLGLAICKGLLLLMGGDIYVESEIGKGSSFYFTIPLKPA